MHSNMDVKVIIVGQKHCEKGNEENQWPGWAEGKIGG